MLTRDFISFAVKQIFLNRGKQGPPGSFHTRPRQRLCRLCLGDRQCDQRSSYLACHSEPVACMRTSRCLALAGPWRTPRVWTFFTRIQTNQRALPIETNVSFHKGWKCQRSVCFITSRKWEPSTGSHDCRVFERQSWVCAGDPRNCPRL